LGRQRKLEEFHACSSSDAFWNRAVYQWISRSQPRRQGHDRGDGVGSRSVSVVVIQPDPSSAASKRPSDEPQLSRRFNLLSASALNMTNMMGVGPFITIPLLMSALGGPQAMLGWIVALVIVICDGMVWSELGAALPGSGGSFVYLRQAFGRARFGRLMAF